jgi:hypothetical protein
MQKPDVHPNSDIAFTSNRVYSRSERKQRVSEEQKGAYVMEALQREPITANENEKPALQKLERVLNSTHHVPELVGPDGTAIELPASVLHILGHIIYHMMHDRAISIVPISKELTTQEAADILNKRTGKSLPIIWGGMKGESL